MAEGIRITDLARPRLTAAARELLAAVTEDMVVLEPEAILDLARRQTGLDDFGAEDFKPRLALACACYLEDEGLSTMGRLTAFSVLLRSAVQRLRFEALWRTHPDVAAVRLERPIIIAGLPRTGTTHLLNLIAADTRLRSLRYWEAVEPFPDPTEKVAPGAEDPRIQRCRDEFALRDTIMPYFKNMHEMLPDHIHEEAELMMLDFSSQFVETLGLLPRWRDDYLQRDQTPHYRYMKRVMQALQWRRGPERWIMKSPQHIEQLPALRDTFPDATYVITHRDPVSVTTSLLTLMAYTGRIGRDPVRPREIADYWVDRFERMLMACVRDIDCLPPEQTIHVRFDDFMADNLGTVDKIYALANQPLTPDVRQGMETYIDTNPRGKHGQVRYDLQGDFGITPTELYRRFKTYMDRFEVAQEQQG